MTQTRIASSFNDAMTALKSWAHSVAPVGTESFETVALFSLACYLVFAVVALQYALKTWAEKVMFTSIAGGSLASLLLHLSMLHSPAHVGEGALWKFVSLSRYLPSTVFIFGCLYLAYRMGSSLRRRPE